MQLIKTRNEGKATKERRSMTETNKLTIVPAAPVQHTSDYDKFKFLKGNRPITAHHVQELVASFEERPQLIELRPVTCNEKMQIVDGQHTMKALEFLNLPVPYTVTPGLTIGEAQLLNALQRPWQMIDYARSYAADGNKDYRIVMDLLDSFSIPVTVMLQYAGAPGHNDKMTRSFKLGRFKLAEDMKVVTDRLGMLTDFIDVAGGFWNTSAFARAFLKAVKEEDYDHTRMITGANKMGGLKRQGSQRDYLIELERAYNFHKISDVKRFI